MDTTNSRFLLTIGLFWLGSALVMLSTGYWASLSAFGVSERLFYASSWLVGAVGCCVTLYGIHLSCRNETRK